MKRKDLPIILAVLALVLAAAGVRAQQPATEAPDQAGPYTVTSSVEVGVRGVKTEGDIDKYRSDLNYQPGFQFLDSSLLMEAAPHEAPLFDTLLVKVTGWDSDPSGYLRVDADKLDWYRFSTTVRRVNYYNALGNLAERQHLDNTEHTFGDVNLVLLPQHRPLRFNVDYSWDRNSGPSFLTYDYSRDEFPLFAPTRYRSDTFSGGFDANVGRVDISFIQGYRRFKDDSFFSIESPNPGNDGPAVPTLLNFLNRDALSRGHINFSRLSVHSAPNERLDVTGRFAYSNAKTESSLYEYLSGVNYLGNTINLGQSTSASTSERPDVLADVGVTVLATNQLRISNTFKYNWFKIDGADDLTETLLLSQGGGPPTSPFVKTDTAYSRLTRYRQFADTLELDYEFHPRISAHVGYRYTDRSVDLEQLDVAGGTPSPDDEPEIENFDNRTNTFLFGLYAKPFKHAWTVYFDFERGEADNVFTRVANYDYTSVRIRNRIHINDTLSLNVTGMARDNDNPAKTEDIPPVDFGTNTKTRLVSVSGDWVPNSKVVLSSGYTYSRVTSDAVILFYFNYVKKQGLSQYFSRDNFAYVSCSAQIHPRVGVYGGYRIHNDTAAGDLESNPPETLISSYPYRFQSPEARVSIRINDRLDLNLGYQYYKFEERFRNLKPADLDKLQDYSAHLPYASLRFYFGRR